MRLLLLMIVSFSVSFSATPSNAGIFKWAGRGVLACAAVPACRSTLARGVVSGGERIGRSFAPKAIEKCLQSARCLKLVDKALTAAAGTTAGVTAWKALDVWMSGNGFGRSEGPDETAIGNGDMVASIMPDPEDPFGPNKDRSDDEKFTPTKRGLQHAYDRHKEDWGFTQNRNNQVLAQYEQRLRHFMRASDTIVKPGLYRGEEVLHYYNRTSRLWLSISRSSGDIGGAWRLSPTQLKYLEDIGKVSTLLEKVTLA